MVSEAMTVIDGIRRIPSSMRGGFRRGYSPNQPDLLRLRFRDSAEARDRGLNRSPVAWVRMQQSPADPPRMVPPGPPRRRAVIPASRPTNTLAIVSLAAGIARYVIPPP